MPKKIIFIHGRATKPHKNDLRDLWYDAVIAGLERDYKSKGKEVFEGIEKRFVYYGDISNDFLHKVNKEKIPDDIESRRSALKTLSDYRRSEFTKSTYNKLIKKTSLKEALADTFSGAMSLVRLGDSLISAVAPDMGEYWNPESNFGSDVRNQLTPVLKEAFDNNDQIMLVSHSLGSMISYDNLWKFSHYGEYRHKYGSKKKVDLFVTLGSPLGDENVKRNLKGKESKGKRCYPSNIKKWVNIAAEDDYISHDSKIKNDFSKMFELGLIENSIKDIYPIYNLTVRNEASNPHSSIGYLVNPMFIDILWDWMNI